MAYCVAAGLGRPIKSVFEYLSDKPVASASLGQVYRGRLLHVYGGDEVAVKVQRPGVLEGSSLDIHIIRNILALASKLPNVSPPGQSILLRSRFHP